MNLDFKPSLAIKTGVLVLMSLLQLIKILVLT